MLSGRPISNRDTLLAKMFRSLTGFVYLVPHIPVHSLADFLHLVFHFKKNYLRTTSSLWNSVVLPIETQVGWIIGNRIADSSPHAN